jgi:hypothetical protein
MAASVKKVASKKPASKSVKPTSSKTNVKDLIGMFIRPILSLVVTLKQFSQSHYCFKRPKWIYSTGHSKCMIPIIVHNTCAHSIQYVKANFKVDEKKFATEFKAALKRGVKSGNFSQEKNGPVKLVPIPESKKKKAAAPAKKTAVKKVKAAKKNAPKQKIAAKDGTKKSATKKVVSATKKVASVAKKPASKPKSATKPSSKKPASVKPASAAKVSVKKSASKPKSAAKKPVSKPKSAAKKPISKGKAGKK